MIAADFDALFYPGGHGPLCDLPEDADSARLIAAFYRAGEPVALVCHAPGALRHVELDCLPLDPKLASYSNYRAGQAISFARSPDKKTLLVLTSGNNSV